MYVWDTRALVRVNLVGQRGLLAPAAVGKLVVVLAMEKKVAVKVRTNMQFRS